MSTDFNEKPVAANVGIAQLPDDNIYVIDILQVLAENLRLLIILPILFGAIALAISFAIAPIFTASTKFLPPQQQQNAAFGMLQSLGGFGGLAGAAAGLKNPVDQYISFLRANAVVDELINEFDLQNRYDQKYLQTTRKLVVAKTKISSGKDGIINLEFEDEDPDFAARVANAYVTLLTRLLNRLAVTEAQQRRSFFEAQLKSTKDALIKAEQSLAASGVGSSALNANPVTALEGPARLRAQVTAQEVKLASMKSYLTEAAPEYRQAQAELGALRAQLTKVEREQPAVGGSANEYIARYREFKYQETLFDLFARQLEMAKVDESREGAMIQLLDKATPPELKSAPKRAIVAIITALATAMLLLIIIYIRRVMAAHRGDLQNAAKVSRLHATIRKQVWRANT